MGEAILLLGLVAAVGWGWGLLYGGLRGRQTWRVIYWVMTAFAIVAVLVAGVLGTALSRKV